jgi:predicted nucleic acid-binding Zn ribbon protein
MAHGLKCYCCGENITSDTHYYCYNCVKILKNMFDTNIADFGGEYFEILENPHPSSHCISCGEFENRRIIDVRHICDKCVIEELIAYEQNK